MALKDTIYMECKTGGSNKFYKMEDLGNGKWLATWGPIGKSGQVQEYPMSDWSTKYSEKVNKKNYKVIRTTPNTGSGTSQTSTQTKKQASKIDPRHLEATKRVLMLVKNIKDPAFDKVNIKIAQHIYDNLMQNGQLTQDEMIELNSIYADTKPFV